MKLTQSIDINENIITATIYVKELGTVSTDQFTEQFTELNQIHNFIREIEYSEIDFKSNMKIANGVPVTTSESTDDSTIEEVEIKDLINKKIVLDENFKAELVINVDKIPESEYGEHVFTGKELLGQAYAVLFIEKIKTAVSEKLAEIRALSSDIENSIDVVI